MAEIGRPIYGGGGAHGTSSGYLVIAVSLGGKEESASSCRCPVGQQVGRRKRVACKCHRQALRAHSVLFRHIVGPAIPAVVWEVTDCTPKSQSQLPT